MKVFVTGVGGQLGHDVINELVKRGHACVGSDLAPEIRNFRRYCRHHSTLCAAGYHGQPGCLPRHRRDST